MTEHRRAVRYEDLELHELPDDDAPRSGAVIVWLAGLGLIVAGVALLVWVLR